MIIWLDAHLSRHLAPWITNEFGIEARSAWHLGFTTAEDQDLFEAARKTDAPVVILTKDDDLVKLVQRLGPPPQIIWVRCGNTSNQHLRALLGKALPNVLELVKAGEALIELHDAVYP